MQVGISRSLTHCIVPHEVTFEVLGRQEFWGTLFTPVQKIYNVTGMPI